MQKITYYCDKCKKIIQTDRVRMEFVSVGTDATIHTFDLHPKCKDEIIELLSAPDPESEDLPAPRKKIDHGKVMALHNAGWKTKDIAGEMALEQKQVSQVIYQEKKKKKSEE